MDNPNSKHTKTLPEIDFAVIEKLVKKYNLGPTDFFDPEVAEKLRAAKTLREKTEAADSFPIIQIPKIIIEIIQEKTPAENLTSLLQERLNVSPEIAKILAKDLKKEVLALTEKPAKEEKPVNKIPLEKPDIYREPTE